MGIPAVTVALEPEQVDEMKPIFDRVREAAVAGDPGMALAQVIGDELKVFFVGAEQAREFQRVMGSRVGLTTADLATS